MEERERRISPRMTLAERSAARVHGLREVRLLDLSRTGVQIEHLDVLRPGAACTLDLTPLSGTWNLPAEVVWCSVICRRRQPSGEWHLVSRSGLQFTALTGAQHAALAGNQQRLARAPFLTT